MMSNPPAAILVIGDEILSGRTRDSNLHYLSCELTKIGINLQEVFDRIHKSNMTKVEKGVTRDPTTGKILKGPNYKEPNLKDLVDG